MLCGGAKHLVDLFVGQARAHCVVHSYKVSFGNQLGERIGDGVKSLGPAQDHLDVHEDDIGPVAALKQFLVIRGNDKENLDDVVAGNEQFGGAQPDGAAVEIGVRLFLLVAEAG